MRKHIDYFYKCYDKMNENEIERTCNERFNEYGYNFDTNRKRVINYDELARKTDYKNVKNSFNNKER